MKSLYSKGLERYMLALERISRGLQPEDRKTKVHPVAEPRKLYIESWC